MWRSLTEGVHRFEGTVNQYTGDGIMAIFGAPIAHEDHARRACFATLHLTETLGLYARELRRERGLSFSVRIGLNSGEVVVGGIGPDLVEAVEDAPPLLGVDVLGELHRPPDVGEEDGDLFALSFQRPFRVADLLGEM